MADDQSATVSSRRFQIVQLPAPSAGLPWSARLGTLVLSDRFVVLKDGARFDVRDLDDPSLVVLQVDDAKTWSGTDRMLVIGDSKGRLFHFVLTDGKWYLAAMLDVPAVPEAVSPAWAKLQVSTTGRYLLTESSRLDRKPNWGVSDAILIEVQTGRVVRSLRLGKTGARAGFSVDRSGAEILFIAAESYMSVQMIDCASGRTINEFVSDGPHDFCHTSFEVLPRGDRLVAFGCYWMGPFETRIYDLGPWIGGEPPSRGFPLPIVARFEQEVFDGDQLVGFRPSGEDDLVSIVSLVELPDDLHSDPLNAVAVADVRTTDAAAYEELMTHFPGDTFLIIRQVDAATGELKRWTLHQVPSTPVIGVHLLPSHQVLVVGTRLLVCDGKTGEIGDYGAVPPGPWSTSRISPNLSKVILR